MSNEYFEFRQFIVRQHHCAMKVGTDGTLLGAWAALPEGGRRVLDIGTGTGLIALMMAQRFPEVEVVGIDIDEGAVLQAEENVQASPFSNRIRIIRADVRDLKAEQPFDAIVCNPPYFTKSLTCPDHQRTLARHTVELTYDILMESAKKLLSEKGILSVIIPNDCSNELTANAHLNGLFISRVVQLKTTPYKPPKRQLIELRKTAGYEFDIKEEMIEEASNVKSKWYHELTKEFYIK